MNYHSYIAKVLLYTNYTIVHRWVETAGRKDRKENETRKNDHSYLSSESSTEKYRAASISKFQEYVMKSCDRDS